MYPERIKEIRKNLGLSVAKMSDKINIPQRTITAYERGERQPSIEFLAQMCINFNLNANWFVTGLGDMFNKENLDIKKIKDEVYTEIKNLLKIEGIIK